jgi:hypothetical protein
MRRAEGSRVNRIGYQIKIQGWSQFGQSGRIQFFVARRGITFQAEGHAFGRHGWRQGNSEHKTKEQRYQTRVKKSHHYPLSYSYAAPIGGGCGSENTMIASSLPANVARRKEFLTCMGDDRMGHGLQCAQDKLLAFGKSAGVKEMHAHVAVSRPP